VSLSDKIKLLANGINPQTGETFEKGSITEKPEVIRMLFTLAEELSGSERHQAKKPKLTPEEQERRQRNIAEGKPAKSHFPWEEEERSQLASEFQKGLSVEQLSNNFERSTFAIAIQLQKMNLISEEDLELYKQH